jgi:hypothetical protein
MTSPNIKPLLWLWLPLVWMVFQLAIEISFSRPVREVIHSEYGPHELVEFLIIGIATLIASRTLFSMDRTANRWLTIWVGLAFLSCFYVMIEEMSWGQTVFQWHTPEFWREINGQRETNLHNTSDWLNKKPRALLEVGIIIGGLIIPFLQRFKSDWLPRRFAIIYPPGILSVTAGIYAGFKLTDHFGRHYFNFDPFARPSEIEEMYLYYFVLLYVLVMKGRLTRAPKS